MLNKPARITAFLLAGTVLMYFSNGRHSTAAAAWLFPIFFLLVSRKEKAVYAYVVIPLLTAVCCQLSFWRFTYDDSSHILFYLPFILGIPMGLLFLTDRLLYSKIKGFSATLIFPLVYTSFDFCLNLFNPFGTLGILGYSQFGFLPFAQLAGITGMWGLTFMITWFGSVFVWCTENYTDKSTVKKGAAIYLTVFLIISGYGITRLTMSLPGSTVKVAGIHAHDKRTDGEVINSYLVKNDSAAFRKMSNVIISRLTAATIKEADDGAKIVVWSEISAKIYKEDEDSLLQVFKALAKNLKIYLLTAPYIADTIPENKVLLFSPDGNLLLTHYKYGGNFMEGTVQGDKIIKTVHTTYGNLSAIICWDGDFPSVVKQTGKLDTDILFIPASDWEEIDPAHAIVTAFRGIENGCSVVRQTRNGLSLMTDARGKKIAAMDHFKNSRWVNTGIVPSKKIFTLYPFIGDLFGWLAIAGLICFCAITILKRNR